MGPTWGPPGSCCPQMGPMLAPCTLLSGNGCHSKWSVDIFHNIYHQNFRWSKWPCQKHQIKLNTLRPRQKSRNFPNDIFQWIFVNENAWISINISLKFVPRGPNNNVPALVQIMAWLRPGDKTLSEPMLVSLLTHICITRPQWVKFIPSFSEKSFSFD